MRAGVWLIAGLCAAAAAVWAGEEKLPAPALFRDLTPASGQPVEINSDRLQVELGSRRVQFSGHVVAQQATRVIYADEVEAFYNESGALLKLKARGNVKMTAEGALATGEELVLDNGLGTLTLKGSPRVVQAGQLIRGKEMVFLLKENRLEISEPRIEWMPANTQNEPQP